MARKPTYEELERRIEELERESSRRVPLEEALRESEEMFRVAFEHAPVGMCLVNPDGRFLNVNSGICHMLGYSESELLTKTFRDITHPDDVDRSDEWVRGLVAGETTISDLEKRYLHKGGHVVWGTVRAFLLRNTNGSPRFFVTHVQNITERRRAEEELRENEERLKLAIEGSQQGFWDWNIETGVVQRNERCAAMLGYTPQELEQTIKQWTDLMHPDDFAAAKKSIYDHLEGRSPKHEIEYRMIAKDGSCKWMLDQARIVKRDARGRPLRLSGTHTDITERKRAEEEKEKLQAQLANAVEMAHLGPWEYDVSADIFTFNDHFYKIFRTTAKEVGGYTMRSAEYARRFVHPDDIAIVAGETRKAIEATDPNFSRKLEHRMLYADGTVGHISVRFFIIKDTQRNTIKTYGVNQDITESKRAEQALRQSEEDYRNLYDEAPVGYIELDSEGRVTRVNQRELEILGYSAEEVLGQPFWRFVLEEGAEETIKAKLAGLIPPSKGFERTYRRKDGTTVSVLINDRMVRDKDGRITANRSANQDITERKRAEEALRASEERYRDLYDEAPVGYQEIDGEGRITKVNRQEILMLGYSAEEMLGRPIWDFIVEEEAREAQGLIRAKLAGLKPPSKDLERTYRRKDGTLVRVLIDDRFVTDDRGRIVGIRTTVRDNTERKRAEEEKEKLEAQLRQAQKMESVGRLAGGVAHDFNNMLGIIVGNVEMAMMRVNPGDPVYHELDETLKAAHRSAGLVRQLLAFARKQTVNPKVLDMNETVSGMLNMLRRLIGEDIDLAWMPSRDLWSVKVDPSQIDQILANLAVNARDAISGVGKMTIETANATLDETYCGNHPGFHPGQYVLLAVSDDGSGMSKAVLEHLFEPFFTTKEAGKGTGLGLASIYGAVKQNAGFINVYSEPGQGTTFKIYLPRFETKTTGGSRGEVKPEALRGGTETVLVVEDEAAILSIGEAMLETLGYTVLTAGTPQEAIRLAREHSGAIDLLLTDVVMPEMNGRELSEQLKAIHPNLKFLFMSGYTANVIAHHGVLNEGTLFLHKPFPMKDLAAKVREALEKG